MGARREYLTAIEAEQEMQKVRIEEEITGKSETQFIRSMIKGAKANSMIGDKLQLVIDPLYIHIPEWQRRLKLSRACAIGNNYNKYKWDVPKVLLNTDGRLYVIDGQHRIFGAFKAGREEVVVEIMECGMEEAIDLFINQSKDRTNMRPMDVYKAAIAAGKEDYLMLRDICHRHNVAIIGEDTDKNTIGMLTSISDGIGIIHISPDLLDAMLTLLDRLQWNGYENGYKGKAYSAKILRSLKKLYAYYTENEKKMEDILIRNCRGTEFFVENLCGYPQEQVFDLLSKIVSDQMEIELFTGMTNQLKAGYHRNIL